MKNTACLILGTCLVLQGVQMNPGDTAHASSIAEAVTVPMHRLNHARELLDSEEFARYAGENLSSREYARFIQERTKDLLPAEWRPHAERVARTLIEEANRYEMDPLLLMAVIRQESRFNPDALGRHGEIGLMQIKPSTARWVLGRRGISAPTEARLRELLKDPAMNIRYGAAYLAHLRESFKGRRHLYISAYNMGPANVRQLVREKTQPRIYSDKVLAGYIAFSTDFLVARTEAANRRYAALQ